MTLVILWVITTLLSFVLRPDPPKGPRAATLDDVEVNSAEDGKEIGVLFGTRDVEPNWVWYGDLKSKPIKKKGGKK